MQPIHRPQNLPILPLGQYLWLMVFKMLLVFVLLFGPAYVIAYIVSSRYRQEVVRVFPFLKDELSRAIVIIWLFLAGFTYLPPLLRFWLWP